MRSRHSLQFLISELCLTVVVSLSGPGGSRIRVFDITNGQLIVEKQLHPPEEGVLTEPLNAGASLAFAGIPNTPDIVVLTNGHTVHNLPGTESGKVWTWKSQDQRCVCSSVFNLPTDPLQLPCIILGSG